MKFQGSARIIISTIDTTTAEGFRPSCTGLILSRRFGWEDRFEEDGRDLDRARTSGDLERTGDEPSRRPGHVQSRCPADPVGPLLPVPRARPGQAEGQPA